MRLAALSFGQVVSWGVLYYAFIVASPVVSKQTGWPLAATTALFSLGLVVSAVAGIPVGHLLDRIGPRPVMTLGSIVGAAGFGIVAIAPDLVVFCIGWIVVGLAQSGVLYQAAFTVITRRYGERRHRPLMLLTVAGGLASTVFAPIVVGLLGAVDWRTAFLILAGVLLVTTVPIHWWSLEPRWEPVPGHRPSAEEHHTVSTVLRERRFWFLEAATILISLAVYAVTIGLIPVFIEKGMSYELAAIALGLLGAGQVVGRLLYVVVPPHVPPWVRFAVAGAAAALALGLLGTLAGPEWLLIGIAILAGAVRGALTLVQAGAVADRWGTRNYGAINGVYSAPVSIAIAFAPAIGAGLAVGVGSYALMATLLAAVAAVGALVARWS